MVVKIQVNRKCENQRNKVSKEKINNENSIALDNGLIEGFRLLIVVEKDRQTFRSKIFYEFSFYSNHSFQTNMKHIPSAVKEKYDILGVIGEGTDFLRFHRLIDCLS